MRDDGPVCECLDGFELKEDGQCQKSEFEGLFTAISCGECDTAGGWEWTDWLNSDTPVYGFILIPISSHAVGSFLGS